MPGIMGMLAASLGPVPTIVSASAGEVNGNPNLVIDKPANVVEGMLLVAIMCSGDPTSSWSGASGWTERVDLGDSPCLRIATKVATGAEPASYTFVNTDVAPDLSGIIIALTMATYDGVGTVQTTSGSGAVVAPSFVMSARGLLLGIYASDEDGTIFSTPTGMILYYDYSPGAQQGSISVFTQIVNAGGTGTRSSTPDEPGENAGVLLGMI